MTPEEMREKILELAIPVRDFCREHGVASFAFDDGARAEAEGRQGTFDLHFFQIPLPPHIKCTLERYGCIYLEVRSEVEGK